MALPRPEHHTMFAQLHWFHVRVDRYMPDCQKTHSTLRRDLARNSRGTDAASVWMALSILLTNTV